MSGFEISKRVGGLTEFECAINDRRNFSGLHEIGEDQHVRFVELCDVGNEFLPGEPRPEISIELTKQTRRETFVPSRSAEAGHDADAVRIQDAPALGERMIPDKIVDEIVTLFAPGEIFLGIIDHVVGADRSHKVDIARAANTSDLGPE